MAPSPFQGQDFQVLKKAALESTQLFEDPKFPAEYSSLFFTPEKVEDVEWKRPKDICSDPKLFVEGSSSGDVSQGSLGNCWLVAATSVLATKDHVLKQVVPESEDQEWNEKNQYAGIFHFHFWQFGEWVDVVIDDRLPTVDGRLIFIHSQSRNEFWSALLEKAYAKLHGCYEVLDGGNLAEALVDFTGGVAEPIDLVEANLKNHEVEKEELFVKMKDAHERESLMAAAISAKSKEEMEMKLDNGLVKGHAYGITAVKRVAMGESSLFNFFNREKLEMIRLRNPWGSKEWNGAFSDGDERWNKISQNEKNKIGLTVEDNGEFWMLFDDFVEAFTDTSICRVVNTSFFSFERSFNEYSFKSSWVRPERAGGCPNNKETFLKNPQVNAKIRQTLNGYHALESNTDSEVLSTEKLPVNRF
jgi:calpain-5